MFVFANTNILKNCFQKNKVFLEPQIKNLLVLIFVEGCDEKTRKKRKKVQ